MRVARVVVGILLLATIAFTLADRRNSAGQGGPRMDHLGAPPTRFEVAALPGGPVGGPVDIIRHPRFKAELISIRAIDESGETDWGSDDIYVVHETPHYRLVTSTYHDFDTGETKLVDPLENCIWPAAANDDTGWSCSTEGGGAPLTFQLSMWEEDEVAIPIWDGFPAAGFCIPARPSRGCIQDPPDDFMFKLPVFSYSEEELIAKLPNPGDFFELTRETTWVRGSDFTYELKVRVTRVADVLEKRPRAVGNCVQ